VRAVNFNGNELFNKSVPVKIEANSSHSYLRLSRKEIAAGENENKIVLIAQIVDEKYIVAENLIYLAHPKDLALEKPEIKINIERIDSGYKIELGSGKLAKDVYMSMEDDGFFSDNYFDLLPGLTKTVEIKTQKEITDLKGKIKIVSLVDSFD
jgi:beta-mannosidase